MFARLAFANPTTPFRDRLPRPRSILLVVLVLAILMMPVSYRAGADHAHPHTIFQGLVDLIAGEPHHHGPPPAKPVRMSVSPFAPVAVPLALLAAAPDADRTLSSMTDIPEALGMSMPITALTAVAALALLLALLLAGASVRPPLAIQQALEALPAPMDPPPPRPS